MPDFFECNIPVTAPKHIHPLSQGRFIMMANAIHERVKKLNTALEYSDMEPNTFAEYAADLFSKYPERFDQMDAVDLTDYVNLVDDGHTAPARLEWPNATVVCDCRFLKTEEWEVLRTIGVGGSDASVIAGSNGHRTRYELFHDKRMSPELMYVNKKPSQVFFDRGHAMEDKVIETFCNATGAVRIPEHRMFASKKYPHNTANIDAIIMMPTGELYVFEAKTSTAENVKAWSGGKIPPAYVPQMRQYPAVLNDDRIQGTFIGCLFTYDYTLNGFFVGADTDVNRFMQRFMERMPEFEERQLKENEEFFTDFVTKGMAPPFENDPQQDKRDLWTYEIGPGNPNAPEVLLSEDVRDAVHEYMLMAEKKSQLNKELDILSRKMDQTETVIAREIGESESAVLPSEIDGFVFDVQYKHASRSNFDKAKLEEFFPDVAAACALEPSAWRTLKIKEISLEERAKKAAKKAKK